MDLIYFIKAFFLGVIEGITEFLPISSTGHLILIGDWINFSSNEEKVFEVVIQLGGILAVCWLFRDKIITLINGVLKSDPAAQRFTAIVMISFLPSAIIGALFIHDIKNVLFNTTVVATALIVGGVIILWVENRKDSEEFKIEKIEKIGFKQAIIIGIAQCIAMIPGTSRSGATIVGGMLSGVSRKAATEYSFFLAIPTMLGAAIYDASKNYHLLNTEDILAILIGFTAAFISALIVVNALIRFVAKHSLSVFAWYRIALGLIIFAVN